MRVSIALLGRQREPIATLALRWQPGYAQYGVSKVQM